jgi:hypothetical protein
MKELVQHLSPTYLTPHVLKIVLVCVRDVLLRRNVYLFCSSQAQAASRVAMAKEWERNAQLGSARDQAHSNLRELQS